MADTPVANTSRNNTYDAKNLYKSVRFQQGRPVLDTELNDLQDMTFEQIVSEIKKDSRFSGIETSPFEWALIPLGDTPNDPKNNDNFAITLGRLPTAFGILDSTNNAEERIPYDYQQLVDSATDDGQLESYPNYMFKGSVSSVTSAVKFVDNSKQFKASHNLVGRQSTIDLSNADNSDLVFNMVTGSCRIVFTQAINANNIGQVRTIVATDQNSITFDQALPAAISVSDKYVIIPENMLTSQRNLWDTADPSSTLLGEAANPFMLPFIQTWEEDISSNEDTEIENPQVGLETTHRIQLRWCLRVIALSGAALRKFGIHYNQITEPFQNVLDPSSTYTGSSTIRDYVRNLLDSHEMSIGKDEIGPLSASYSLQGDTLENSTFPTERLLKSHGLTVSSETTNSLNLWQQFHNHKIASELSSVNPAYKIPSELASVQGTALISEAVLRTFGDRGFLDWDVLKSFTLIHLYDGVENVSKSISVSILGLWSSPSKRLKTEWLDTGADPSRKSEFAPVDLLPIADTLSPSYWVNSIKLVQELDNAQNQVTPRVGYVPALDGIGCQPSLYVTPPRIFFKQSEISTELATSRQKFYGNNPFELMETLRSVYKPADVSRYIIRERNQLLDSSGNLTDYSENVVYSSISERINYLENLLSILTGLSSVQVLHKAFASHNSQEVKLLPSMANKILSSDHSQGIAQSGVSSSRSSNIDDINAIKNYRSGNRFEDNSMSMGSVAFVNPLTGNNSNQSLGETIDQVVNFSNNVIPSIKTREAVNGEYAYKANDENLGFTNRRGINDKREVHQGIAQNLAFMQAFNFRKLAIKTSSHTEGDLFTINVPQWWELKQSDNLFADIMANRVEIMDESGNPTGQFKLSESFFKDILFNSLNGQSGTALSSFYSSFRSQLAKVDETGPMGLTSYAGLGLTAPVGELLTSGTLGKNLGPSATNQNLLPFLDRISGSSAIARWDYTGSQDTEAGYASSLASSSSALNDLSRSAWGRRSIDPQAFVDIAYSQEAVGTSDRNAYSVMPSNIDSNRCTSLRLRYHVGDFYPGNTDERGIPENLLVDNLNLYVRVEPLPLVHWMTMPKHQHSILEGSMDMSEAIATLMDLANGRGIPDHLFTLSDSWRPFNAEGDSFGLNTSNYIPNSKLSIKQLIKGETSQGVASYDQGCQERSEVLSSLYNSPVLAALRAIGIPILVEAGHPYNVNNFISLPQNLVDPATPSSLQIFPTHFYLEEKNLGSGELPQEYPKFVTVAEFQATFMDGILGNNPATYSKRFTENTEIWTPFFELWQQQEQRPVYESTTTQYWEEVYDWFLGLCQTVANAYLLSSTYEADEVNHDSNGGVLASNLQVVQDLLEGKSSLTLPIIPTWLARSMSDSAPSTQQVNEDMASIIPSLHSKKNTTYNTDTELSFGSSGFTALSVFSKVSRARIEQLIKELAEEEDISVKEAMELAFQDSQYKVRVGSVDPVGVCMPTSSHPFVHWHHPNMRAITAPGGPNGLSLDMGDSANNPQNVNDLRYTPYNEWGRDSLVMTGIVPFGGQAERLRISMGYGAISGYNADSVANARQNAGLNERIYDAGGFLIDSGESNFNIHDNIGAFLTNSDSPSELSEALYSSLFDFQGTSGYAQVQGANAIDRGEENPWTSSWEAVYNNGTDIVFESTDNLLYPTMIPYFSYSSGYLGLGGISRVKDGNYVPPQFFGNNWDSSIVNKNDKGLYDIWANWFPYLPNTTHADADVLKFRSKTNLNATVAQRLKETVFAQHTGPVYLPASRSVYKRNEQYLGESEIPFIPQVNGNDPDNANDDRDGKKEVPKASYVHEHNTGYHPMLGSLSSEFADTSAGSQGKVLRSTLSYPMTDRTSQIIDILGKMSQDYTGVIGDEAVFLPNVNDTETLPFDGAALRSAISTETLGWINLYTKTYNRVYGHKSIHPYASLDSVTEKPIWHKDFTDSKGITSGKGPDKDVDTLYAGDLGTGLYVSKRSVFMDPLCLGVGAVRSSGQIVHDSAEDQEETFVFRDIFDLCAYEREIMSALDNSVERKYGGIIKTSSAWSNMGMQSKLLFNSSLRILHTRPSGALSTSFTNQKASSDKEANYGGNTVPKSLTEMFLCIDPKTNKLHKAPRASIKSPAHKPFIHLESLIHSDQAGDFEHPNYKVMKRLNPMVCTNLTGKADGANILHLENNNVGLINNLTFDPNTLVSENNDNQSLNLALTGQDSDFSVMTQKGQRTDEQFNQDLAVNMGDAFSVDPFDLMWESTITQSIKNKFDNLPATANTAQNSGVEYELLSSLARIHAQKDNLELNSDFNSHNSIGLIDTLPTPNELTLPGDHEIVFVLYTGDYGNQMVSDEVAQGVNPPIAGCHIKASIEINRPSERYDSETYGESTLSDRGIHYGSVTPYALSQKNNTASSTSAYNPTGLHTYSIAGGRPTMDLAVYDHEGNIVVSNATPASPSN